MAMDDEDEGFMLPTFFVTEAEIHDDDGSHASHECIKKSAKETGKPGGEDVDPSPSDDREALDLIEIDPTYEPSESEDVDDPPYEPSESEEVDDPTLMAESTKKKNKTLRSKITAFFSGTASKKGKAKEVVKPKPTDKKSETTSTLTSKKRKAKKVVKTKPSDQALTEDIGSFDCQEEPPAKKKNVQRYVTSWEKEEAFKGWLSKSVKGNEYYFCKACNCHGKAGKSEIDKHAFSSNHQKAIESVSKTESIQHFCNGSDEDESNLVKKAEILFLSFLIEHNIAFLVADHFAKLLPHMIPDSEIAKQIKCSRTKATAVTKNKLGIIHEENLVLHLQKNKFSLLVDEASDYRTIKYMCLVVRIIYSNLDVHDVFLHLESLASATADILFKKTMVVSEEKKIDLTENLVGYASDGANVMQGVNHSFATLLKAKVPGVFVLKCICHSFHLCASAACEKLPPYIEILAKDIYSYFSNSPLRTELYREFQHFCGTKPHKLLHPSATRWLSLLAVVKRLVTQYSALKLYFFNAVHIDHISAAESINAHLQNPFTLLCYLFLESALPHFVDLNLEMQAERPKIHLLYDNLTTLLKSFLDSYIDTSYLRKTKIEDVEFKNPRHYRTLEEIYLPSGVKNALQTQRLQNDDVQFFRLRCLDFYVEAASQIQKRFDPKILKSYQSLKFLDPKVVKKGTLVSLNDVCTNFPTLVSGVDVNQINKEWSKLKFAKLPEEEDVQDFWRLILQMKKGDGSPMYPLLGDLVKSLFVLPHSNAAVERVFSATNRIISNKDRNSLLVETLRGILHAKADVNKTNCFNFQVSKEHLAVFNANMYKDVPIENDDEKDETNG